MVKRGWRDSAPNRLTAIARGLLAAVVIVAIASTVTVTPAHGNDAEPVDPPADPPPAAPTKVLLIGDSLMEQSARYWQPAMDHLHRNAVVTNASYGGAGLLYPDFWPRFVASLDEHPDTNVVIAEFIGNCWNIWSTACPAEAAFGSFWYYVLWDYVQDQMVAEVQRRDMEIRWVLSPPIDEYIWLGPVITAIHTQTAVNMASLGIPVTDWGVQLSYDGSGAYSLLKWITPLGGTLGLYWVRWWLDGVHLSDDGARWVAETEASAATWVPAA